MHMSVSSFSFKNVFCAAFDGAATCHLHRRSTFEAMRKLSTPTITKICSNADAKDLLGRRHPDRSLSILSLAPARSGVVNTAEDTVTVMRRCIHRDCLFHHLRSRYHHPRYMRPSVRHFLVTSHDLPYTPRRAVYGDCKATASAPVDETGPLQAGGRSVYRPT